MNKVKPLSKDVSFQNGRFKISMTDAWWQLYEDVYGKGVLSFIGNYDTMEEAFNVMSERW